jgi:hypothetical protein
MLSPPPEFAWGDCSVRAGRVESGVDALSDNGTVVRMDEKPKPKFAFRLSPEDQALLEPLRQKLALRSHGAVVRKALRDLAKANGLKVSG